MPGREARLSRAGGDLRDGEVAGGEAVGGVADGIFHTPLEAVTDLEDAGIARPLLFLRDGVNVTVNQCDPGKYRVGRDGHALPFTEGARDGCRFDCRPHFGA